MARNRSSLPQLGKGLFLTDGGIETTLIFDQGFALPDFAAFDLLRRPGGEAALLAYFRAYSRIAARFGTGLILESATWRASDDWGAKLGYDGKDLIAANLRAIGLLEEIRDQHGSGSVVISGCVGPRADGYVPARTMSVTEAELYHGRQVETFARSAADMVTAITMNYAEEAIGIARAAQRADMPVALSFTVETDGRLPTGESLAAAIARVDAATASYPSYYMLNCAHPTHFAGVVEPGAAWSKRIRGLRANASCKSHAELNDAKELETGDPAELGLQYAELKRHGLPNLAVMGGCCGTDHRHVEMIAAACAPLFSTQKE